jgi:hypothetical protein
MRKKRGKGRICIYDSTINHPLANDVVRSSVYLTTLSAGLVEVGAATGVMLESERRKVHNIRDKINHICFLQGDMATGEPTEETMEELEAMMASIPADWAQVAPIDYMKTFVRQVSADFFFESLVENTRLDMLNLQMHIKTVESMQRKEWTSEVISLKRENYEGNIDRIIYLEGKLNDAT